MYGVRPTGNGRFNYAATNVLTSAWMLVSGSTQTNGPCRFIQVFDSSGQVVKLGTSADAGTTVTTVPTLVHPGGFNNPMPVAIPSGSALYIRAVTATISSGEFEVTYLA